MREPEEKRAIAFIDGQNLYRHAKDAFGHHHPNFDPVKLHRVICEEYGWVPSSIRFYTGVPPKDRDHFWNGYWQKRLLSMSRAGIVTITRPLRYRDVEAFDKNGERVIRSVAQEKGIDVRLALDIIWLALTNQYDVAVIFSQDQDLKEVVSDIKDIAKREQRWIKLACAYPFGPNATTKRGIDGTQWIRMEEALYNRCLDSRDYRPRST